MHHFCFLGLCLYVSVVGVGEKRERERERTVLLRRVRGQLQSLILYGGLQEVVTLDVRGLNFV